MTTHPQQDDERRLVEAAQADPARFLELYDLCFHRVWSYVVRRTASREEAEDVTAEVFQRALANLKTYEWRGAPFFAWLKRIAMNELAARWQKSARDSGDPPPDVEETNKDLERRAMVFQLVDRLPEVQRRVIELRFVEDRSLLDVAEELGKTEGAIKQLQRRALEHLRAEWEARHA